MVRHETIPLPGSLAGSHQRDHKVSLLTVPPGSCGSFVVPRHLYRVAFYQPLYFHPAEKETGSLRSSVLRPKPAGRLGQNRTEGQRPRFNSQHCPQTTICNSSPSGSNAISWPLRELHALSTQTSLQAKHSYTRLQTKNNQSKRAKSKQQKASWDLNPGLQAAALLLPTLSD